MRDPEQIVAWAKSVLASEMMYLRAVALPKLSTLSLYYRILPQKLFRSLTLVVVSIVVLKWLAFIFDSVSKCSPIVYQWDKSIVGGRCFSVLQRASLIPNSQCTQHCDQRCYACPTNADGMEIAIESIPQDWPDDLLSCRQYAN